VAENKKHGPASGRMRLGSRGGALRAHIEGRGIRTRRANRERRRRRGGRTLFVVWVTLIQTIVSNDRSRVFPNKQDSGSTNFSMPLSTIVANAHLAHQIGMFSLLNALAPWGFLINEDERPSIKGDFRWRSMHNQTIPAAKAVVWVR
jgi:hypothetical protein